MYQENASAAVQKVINAAFAHRYATSSALSTRDGIVYSYALPIGNLKSEYGPWYVLDKRNSPSVTTSKHIGYLMRELPSKQIVVVDDVMETDGHEPNGQHPSGSIGATQGGFPVAWSDEYPYTETFKLPKVARPVDVLYAAGSNMTVPKRIYDRLFPKWDFKDHLDAMLLHHELSDVLWKEWEDEVSAAVKKYGDGNGRLISGIYRDHFPDSVKDKLRNLAHMSSSEGDASYAHYYASGKRRPYAEVVHIMRGGEL